ncbi:hypothetical protein O181_041168 [Austropuccinia psidii MF-1]|uniref:ABC-2 type transporter transmembrane domain-containing protein n=1 Tax=Austropuccinia psidii MF-1 TaxID=1389203 RepID=A0A9Q3DGV7_9BASI|nr:hypothetical protein [Austropuccinia psidii MF-1]
MEAVKDDQAKGVSHKSPYTVAIFSQLKALVLREIQLTLQDRVTLTVDFLNAILTAIVLGTVFLSLPTTSAGIFTCGGALFVSLLFNVFICMYINQRLPKVLSPL